MMRPRAASWPPVPRRWRSLMAFGCCAVHDQAEEKGQQQRHSQEEEKEEEVGTPPAEVRVVLSSPRQLGALAVQLLPSSSLQTATL